MSPGKYLLCILGLVAGAALLISRYQSAMRTRFPAEFANQAKHLNVERLANLAHSPSTGHRLPFPSPTSSTQSRSIGALSLPASLEENLGQAPARAAFVGRGAGLTVLLTRDGIELVVSAGRKEKGTARLVKLSFADHILQTRSSKPTHGNIQWRGRGKLRGETNYLLGRDARRWHTHVPHFARAEAESVVNGVGVQVYGSDAGIEYDLRLAPGTDADRLRLEVSGADALRLDSVGNLLIVADGRSILMRKPAVYEELRGEREVKDAMLEPENTEEGRRGHGIRSSEQVDGSYVLKPDGSVGFRVGPHRRDATLVLDPSLSLSYSTFLGGAGEDSANSIALDSMGKVYVGGTTTSAATFSETGAASNGPGGGADFFIAKIDPTASGASSLVYLTFLGGSGDEAGGQIAVDGNGNVGNVGTSTSVDFPVTDASKRTSGANDLAVSEIGPSGATLIFSTLFGGSGAEATQNPGGIAFDKSANIFVASDTTSTDLTATMGAFRMAYGGGGSDGFLAVFRPSATPHLKYCTYLGMNAQVNVGGVAVDAGGNAYVAGSTSNPGASFTALNGFQSSYGGDPSDGFLMKIRPSGGGASDLAYATFLGGSGLDKIFAVAVGSAMPATAYVTGTTQSTNFPVNGAKAGPQTHLKGIANAFFAAVAQDATSGMTSLNFSTYLGGSESDTGTSVAIVAANVAYVAGKTTSYDFPWLDNFQPFNGAEDAFVAKLDPTAAGAASLVYVSPLGGTAPPGLTAVADGNAIAADSNGHVYLAGRTTAADFPRAGTPGNGLQTICASCQASPPAADAFVVALGESGAAAPSVSFTAARINFGQQPVGSQNTPPLFAGIVNTGEAHLNVASLGITGPNSSDFALVLTEACMTAPISPGATCSFEVSFAPSIVGPEQAFLTFADDGPASPQVLELVGVGNGPLAVAMPARLDFGNQPEGTSSFTQVLRLENLGNQNLIISSFGRNGPDISQFTLSACSLGNPVTPGNSCELDVTFVPSAVSQFHAEIDVFDDSGNVPGAEQIIPLTGTGTAPAPILNLVPMQLAFGTQAVGTMSGAQTVTAKNVGSTALTFTAIGLSGFDAGSFGITASGANPCPISGGTLAIGATCTVAVEFAPQSSGTKNATLSFTDNSTGSLQTVALTGGAIAPVIQISPSTLNFGVETVGMTSGAQIVTLSNTGQGPLAINSISLTGANQADFRQTNNCPPSLAAGIICNLSVTLSPTVVGNLSGSITVADNAAGSPHSVALAGIGALPAVSIAPATISFAAQLAGSTSAPVNLTVTNTGAGVLQISKISFGGANASDFNEKMDNCSNGIKPNGNCTIPIVFAPTGTGSRTAQIIISDNAPGSPQAITLSGTAVDFSIVAANGGAMSATVKPGDKAAYQLLIVPVNGFAGTITFPSPPCKGEPSASTCTATPVVVPVAANASSPFEVDVQTTAPSHLIPHTSEPVITWGLPSLPIILPLGATMLACLLLLAKFLKESYLDEPCQDRPPGRGTKRRAVFATFLWVLLVMASVSCGSNGNGANGSFGTPPGTSTLTLTVLSSGAVKTVPLTLIVLQSSH
ncbi:MAG: choice-of-anchor D domain-containing protein [Candidatus Acidiferrales bacterium]